ncbi:DUF4062 domain-containing protein [Mesorhizobium sp. M1307]|uniref:DUF4062 domain-containing protein n=1 Tax=unclassified Mesorhizobium TaxID=325217 RepID=UPI003339AD04
MDVEYQIFVSSTYADLVDERRSVIESVLNLGHIPVGMEAFQASDDTQWDYIKRRIDDSDYYVLIVAERYGSELKGKSYTQMEYEYAVAQGVSTGGVFARRRCSQDVGRGKGRVREKGQTREIPKAV